MFCQNQVERKEKKRKRQHIFTAKHKYKLCLHFVFQLKIVLKQSIFQCICVIRKSVDTFFSLARNKHEKLDFDMFHLINHRKLSHIVNPSKNSLFYQIHGVLIFKHFENHLVIQLQTSNRKTKQKKLINDSNSNGVLFRIHHFIWNFFFQNEKIALHRPQNKYVKSNQRQIEFQLMTMMMTKMKHSHSNTQKKKCGKNPIFYWQNKTAQTWENSTNKMTEMRGERKKIVSWITLYTFTQYDINPIKFTYTRVENIFVRIEYGGWDNNATQWSSVSLLSLPSLSLLLLFFVDCM